ncbi:MAG: MFS transporter [Thermomicrobiales bacterium]|nr:MFS transporter [Thermomicrobiales bacterium]MCO5217512.1 MFS transporter [Thermomicrobiales bacterium]MCO5223993.1 MFS transporter [Thermomicrobiales bacterium]MCO5226807.1 MFS transporter [Thermomicrobiales bacterium]
MRFTKATPQLRLEARSESVTIGAGYFTYYAGVGSFTPFSAVYYHSLGFTGWHLGLLTAMTAIGIALTGPFWGALADSFGIHRQIMRGVLLVAAIMALILAQVTSFVPFLITFGILAFALVPIPSLWDSYAVSAVERGGASYGLLRVFGSIGFTVMVLIMGWIMAGGLTVTFIYIYAIWHIITLLVTFRLPPLSERRRRNLTDGLRVVLRQRSYVLILIVAFIISTGYALLNIYLHMHVESIGGNTRIASYAFATSAMSELPVFVFGAVILRKIGPRNMIYVSLAFYVFRFALLGFLSTTTAVIVGQMVHGLSFGMFLMASVTLAHRLVGRENAATAQALLAMMGMGLGSIVGSFIGGVVIEHTTTTIMYRGVMTTMILAAIVFVVGTRLLGRDAFDPEASGNVA